MGVVRHAAVIDGPREKVFRYVDDYRNVPEFMFGITRFEPTGELISGLGATFAVAVDIGPKTLKSVVTCVEWVEGEVIKLEAVEGFAANTLWCFADADGTGTKLDAEFSYTLPGGLAGRALGAIVGPFANQAVRHAEANIAKHVAGG